MFARAEDVIKRFNGLLPDEATDIIGDLGIG
jgi:hypothetical protein